MSVQSVRCHDVCRFKVKSGMWRSATRCATYRDVSAITLSRSTQILMVTVFPSFCFLKATNATRRRDSRYLHECGGATPFGLCLMPVMPIWHQGCGSCNIHNPVVGFVQVMQGIS